MRRDQGGTGQIAAAGLVALLYALTLFDTGFITGTSSYWDLPLGLQGGYIDQPGGVAAYYWFAQTPWSWPLLQIPQMDFPAGMNGYNADFIPLAAILGKLATPLFATPPNPYPAWILGCFALNGAAMAVLCRAMGARSWTVAVAAGGFAAMLPVMHMRFGHIALHGQWPIILSLAILLAADRDAWPPRRLAGAALAVVAIASLVNIYVLAISVALCMAAVLRLALRRWFSIPEAAALGLLLMALPLAILWALGLFSVAGLTARTTEFGRYSANLLSLFWPQTSAIGSATGIPVLGVEVIDATGGQYEGYAWLGLGVLLLLLVLPPSLGQLRPILVRRWFPLLVIGGFLLWSVLPVIHIGALALPAIPVPGVLEETVFAWLRSNGRMLWPVLHLLVAAAIVGTVRGFGRAAPLVLAVALLIQWVDLADWRSQLARTTSPARDLLPSDVRASVSRDVARAGFIQTFPAILCTEQDFNYLAPNNRLVTEFQIIAARANAAMPMVVKARGRAACSGPESLLREDGRLRTPIFVFNEAVDQPDLRPELDALDCRPMAGGLFCTGR